VLQRLSPSDAKAAIDAIVYSLRQMYVSSFSFPLPFFPFFPMSLFLSYRLFKFQPVSIFEISFSFFTDTFFYSFIAAYVGGAAILVVSVFLKRHRAFHSARGSG
jgi:hypothetical protein